MERFTKPEQIAHSQQVFQPSRSAQATAWREGGCYEESQFKAKGESEENGGREWGVM